MKRFNFSSNSSEVMGLVALLIVIGVVGRLVPHMPNFTPIGAIAVWSGMRLGTARGLAVVLGSMFVTDFFLGFSSQTVLVYSALALGTIVASLAKKVTFLSVAGITLVNTAIFFLITNNNYLYSVALYPKTLEGMMTSYAAGIPFLRPSLLGDIAYVALFFGVEYLVVKMTERSAQPAVTAESK